MRKPCLNLQQQQSGSSDPQASDRNGDQSQLDSPQRSPASHLDDETADSSVVDEPRARK